MATNFIPKKGFLLYFVLIVCILGIFGGIGYTLSEGAYVITVCIALVGVVLGFLLAPYIKKELNGNLE